jgi:hypothetical protein
VVGVVEYRHMSQPIVTFALPRSGSTFLMRLLNRCQDQHNKTVHYNGECDVLHSWCEMLNCVNEQDNGGVKSIQQLTDDKEFLSHYHRSSTSKAAQRLIDFWPEYCGADNNTWGWKNVNYGYNEYQKFANQIQTLINAYPNIKFIFLDRTIDDVVSSMIKTNYWEIGKRVALSRIKKQMANYEKAVNQFRSRCYVLPYEKLIDQESFQEFISQLKLKIDSKQYYAISKKVNKNDVGTKTEKIREEAMNHPR